MSTKPTWRLEIWKEEAWLYFRDTFAGKMFPELSESICNTLNESDALIQDYKRLKTQLRLSEEHAGTMARDFDNSLEVVRAERDKLRSELIALTPIAAPALARDRDQKPLLTGTWRYSEGTLFCGTLRIACEDFDTDPSPQFKNSLFKAMCACLNSATEKDDALLAARSQAQSGALEWRPIDTAPKDGTEFIGISGDSLAICSWEPLDNPVAKHWGIAGTWHRKSVASGKDLMGAFSPTDWTPLPSRAARNGGEAK